MVQNKTLYKYKSSPQDPPGLKTMLRHRQHFLLYRKIQTSPRDWPTIQFILPANYIVQTKRVCHDNFSHLEGERSCHLLRHWFYWSSMAADVNNHVKTCDRCLRFKSKPPQAWLQLTETTHSLKLIHMDCWLIKLGNLIRTCVLLVTDHFMFYTQAYVMPSQIANVVTKMLWDSIFLNYGLPEKMISDQGRNFESSLITELWQLAQVKKLRTTPYRPKEMDNAWDSTWHWSPWSVPYHQQQKLIGKNRSQH